MSFLQEIHRVSGKGLLGLLEIASTAFDATLRICDDNAPDPIISNGNEYVCYPFGYTLPTDTNSTAAQLKLVIGNAGRSITEDLEKWLPGTPVYGKLMLANQDNPDIIYKTFYFPMSDIVTNTNQASATLGSNQALKQAASRLVYDPYFSPGLF